jgi:hypothetical protein
MKVASLLVVVAVFLSGCAADKGWSWQKPNGDYQSLNMDHAQCRAQGLAGTRGMVTFGTVMIMHSCMEGKGWYKVSNP